VIDILEPHNLQQLETFFASDDRVAVELD